jgi:hypothetical protein
MEHIEAKDTRKGQIYWLALFSPITQRTKLQIRSETKEGISYGTQGKGTEAAVEKAQSLP